MTKKEIKEWYNDNFNRGDEKVADIHIWLDIFEPYDICASVITVSKDHTVRKTTLRKRNNTILVENRIRID